MWQPLDTGHGNTNQHLTNNKGTVIHLTGRTSGLSTNYGIGKFIIGLE